MHNWCACEDCALDWLTINPSACGSLMCFWWFWTTAELHEASAFGYTGNNWQKDQFMLIFYFGCSGMINFPWWRHNMRRYKRQERGRNRQFLCDSGEKYPSCASRWGELWKAHWVLNLSEKSRSTPKGELATGIFLAICYKSEFTFWFNKAHRHGPKQESIIGPEQTRLWPTENKLTDWNQCRTNSPALFSFFLYNTTVSVHIGRKKTQFFILQRIKGFCLPAWLLEAHEGRRFTLIKYGLLADWMNANVFKPLNRAPPGDIRACRAILLCVLFLITV